MQFPARFKLPPYCPPYGALPPTRLLQMLSGVEGSPCWVRLLGEKTEPRWEQQMVGGVEGVAWGGQLGR